MLSKLFSAQRFLKNDGMRTLAANDIFLPIRKPIDANTGLNKTSRSVPVQSQALSNACYYMQSG